MRPRYSIAVRSVPPSREGLLGKAPVMPRATRKATRTAADTSKDALKRARTFIDKVIVPRRRAAARPDPRIARAGRSSSARSSSWRSASWPRPGRREAAGQARRRALEAARQARRPGAQDRRRRLGRGVEPPEGPAPAAASGRAGGHRHRPGDLHPGLFDAGPARRVEHRPRRQLGQVQARQLGRFRKTTRAASASSPCGGTGSTPRSP